MTWTGFSLFVAGGTMDDKRSAKGDVFAYALSAGGREEPSW